MDKANSVPIKYIIFKFQNDVKNWLCPSCI